MKAKFRIFPLAAALAVGVATVSQAATTYYWATTTTGTWATPANWWTTAAGTANPAAAPLAADSVVFNGTGVIGAAIVQLDADTATTGLTFNNTGTTAIQAFDATVRKLTIGTGGITLAATAGNVTIGTDVTLSGAQTWNTNSKNLVINGTTNAAGFALGKAASGGAIQFNGNATLGAFSLGGSNDGGLMSVTGGTFTATSVSLSRSNAYQTAPTLAAPISAATNSGFYVNGASVSATLGSLTIGTTNSSASARLDAGSLTVTGTLTLGKANTSRWDIFHVNGGTFSAPDTVNGIVIAQNNGTTANNAELYLSGGTSTAGKIAFGASTDTVGGAGWLILGNPSAATPTLYVGVGGIVKASTIGTYTCNIGLTSGTLGAAANWSSDLAMTLGTNPTIQAADSTAVARSITLSGNLTGTSFTKTGAGVLTLAGTNSYTGNPAVTAGVLSIATTAALPGWSTAGRYSIASGAGLAVGNGVSDADVTTLLGAGNLASGASLGFDTTAGDRTYSAVLADGSGTSVLGLAKVGANTLILDQTNTYSGGTSVLAGTLELTKTSALANYNTPGKLVVASGAAVAVPYGGASDWTSGEIDTLIAQNGSGFAAGSCLAFDTTNGSATYATNITGTTLGVAKQGANTLTLTGTASTYAGVTKVLAGTLELGGAGRLGSGSYAGTIGLSAGAVFKHNTSAAQTLSGVISGGGSITKAGAGLLTLSGVSTFTGGLTLQTGQLTLGTGAVAGTGAIALQGGTTFWVNGGNNDFNTLANNISVAAGQTAALHLSPRVNVSGSLTGASDTTLNLTLQYVRDDFSGDWSGFAGHLNVTSGAEFRVSGTHGFGSAKVNLGTGVFVHQTLAPTGTTTVQNIGELSGVVGATLSGVDTAGKTVAWSVGGLNTDSTFAGLIANGTGFAALTKVGTGSLTLSGANTYSGATQIAGGKLIVAGSLGATAVEVQNSATLDVGNNTAGNAALGASVTVNSGGHLAFHLAGTQVTRTLTGTLALNGVVDITAATTPADGTSYTLATTTGSITGTPTLGTLTGVTGTLSVVGGNSLVFTVGSASGYGTWATSKGLDGTVGHENGALDDPNHNGLTNVVEYVLNGDPLNGESLALIVPTLDASGSNFVFSFTRREESAHDTTQVFQYGNNLSGWTTLNITPPTAVEVELGTPSGGLQTVKVTVAKSGTPMFGRLQVTN